MTLRMDTTGCQLVPYPKVLVSIQPETTTTTVDSYQNAAALEVTLNCSSYNVEIDGQIN